MKKVLSAHIANNMFWLGRYAERGYQMMHLMRKAYDEVIDVHEGESPYSDFLEKLGGYVANNMTTSYQMMAQIYDPNTVSSLYNIIERMMDNAIVLRPYICSESCSYIELCRDFLKKKSEVKEMNITELQPITDWLLAFWGSIRERVSGSSYAMLEVGRLVEHIDMNIRFEYKHYRIDETWDRLKKYMVTEPDLFDRVQAGRFEMFAATQEAYTDNIKEHKTDMIAALNGLVKI
ncbi:MAG: alpha-E domain-containing protein [Bacteroidaceae bacterium]|nr:alpha-E domain-containing protein [Bacteroidaceae bacterium]